MASSSKKPYLPPVCASADITITPARKSPPRTLLSRKEVKDLFGLNPEDDKYGPEDEKNDRPATGKDIATDQSPWCDSLHVRESKTVHGSRQVSRTLSGSSVSLTNPSAKRAKTAKASVHKEASAGPSTPATEDNTNKHELNAKAKAKRKADSELPSSLMPSKITRTTSSSPRYKLRKTAKNLDTSSSTPVEYFGPRSSLESSHQSAPTEAPTSSTHIRPQSRTRNIPLPQVQRMQAAVGPAYVEPLRASQTPSPSPAAAHLNSEQESMSMPELSEKAGGKRKADPELPTSPMPSKVVRKTSSSPRPKFRKTAKDLDSSSFATLEYVNPRSFLTTSGSHQSAPAEASTLSTHARPQSRTPNIPRPQVQRAQAIEYPTYVAPPLRASQAPSLPPALAQSSRQAVVHGNRVTGALPQRVQQLNPTSTLRPIPHATWTAQGAPQPVYEAPVLHPQSRFLNTRGPVLEGHAVSQASQAPVLYVPPAVDPYETWYHDQQAQVKEAKAQERLAREVYLRYNDEAKYYKELLSDYEVNSPASNYKTTVPDVPLYLEHPSPLKDDSFYPFKSSTYSTLIDEKGRYPHIAYSEHPTEH